jgi:hypothetical protein
LNPVIQAQFSKFKEVNPVEAFSDSDYFECYSIYSLLNGYLGENVDPFAVHLKGKEFGIDGACILIDGNIVSDIDEIETHNSFESSRIDYIFIQSKSGTKYDYGDVSKFFNATFDFFNGKMRGQSGQLDNILDISEYIYRKSLRKNPNITCIFVNSGALNSESRINDLISQHKQRLKNLNQFNNVEVHLMGAAELQQAYRSATTSNIADIEFPKCVTLPPHPHVKQAHIGYINSEQLLVLATKKDEEGVLQLNPIVFFDNVRDYNIESKINSSIASDIRDGDRSGFVFKNNGVTVIARRLNRTGDRFRVEDYQIVNGCQTTNIIFRNKEVIEGLYVPFRLIESDNEKFITGIIVGTNTQNTVKDEQFWALRPFMKNLEEFSRQQPPESRLFIERRENQYRSESVERKRIVKPTDVMKAVAGMYLFQPHRAARNFREIRSEFDSRIFHTEHDVQLYHLAAFANYKFDFFVRNNRVPSLDRIFKYYALCAVGFEFLNGKSLIDIGFKEQQRASGNLKKFLLDEAVFLAHVQNTIVSVKKLVADRHINSENLAREKLRDTLRNDAFSKTFLNTIQ